MRGLACLLLLLQWGSARAEDVDTEIARRHFDTGRVYYSTGDYTHALEEFSAARKVLPLPALDFNIGRCLDRMEKPEGAIEAYRRYLQAMPEAPDAAEVRSRVEQLEKRVAPPPLPAAALPPAPPPTTTAPAPTRSRRPMIIGVTVSIAAALVVAGAVGLGVGLSGDSYTLGTIRSTR
jgi:tetratricopeptide (TPR) repeat protein